VFTFCAAAGCWRSLLCVIDGDWHCRDCDGYNWLGRQQASCWYDTTWRQLRFYCDRSGGRWEITNHFYADSTSIIYLYVIQMQRLWLNPIRLVIFVHHYIVSLATKKTFARLSPPTQQAKFGQLTHHTLGVPAFLQRGKTSFASAVYATANPSVRMSVRSFTTLRYCVKTRERRGTLSSPWGRPVSLVF